MPQDRPKTAPRSHQDRSKALQDRPKTPQDRRRCSKTLWSQNCLQMRCTCACVQFYVQHKLRARNAAFWQLERTEPAAGSWSEVRSGTTAIHSLTDQLLFEVDNIQDESSKDAQTEQGRHRQHRQTREHEMETRGFVQKCARALSARMGH